MHCCFVEKAFILDIFLMLGEAYSKRQPSSQYYVMSVNKTFVLFLLLNQFAVANFYSCFSRLIYKLLASKSENIRVQSLKVLGYFLKHLGHK